jgi:predicted signal transduction protein with EAL and GGDEF domain
VVLVRGRTLHARRPDALSAVAVVVPTAVAIGAVLGHKAELMRKAHDTMTRAAFTDELTGLGNLRHAQTLLASLAGNDVVVILDLDHFKAVNDDLTDSATPAATCCSRSSPATCV